MAKKNSPEIIKLSDGELDTIKARIANGSILEEDKPVILSILNTYQWLYSKLKIAKLSIKRLKSLFGFSTEKHSSLKKPDIGDPSTVAPLDSSTANDPLNNTEEPPIKKKPKPPPKWDPNANHGRMGVAQYTGCEQVIMPPLYKPGMACPACAALQTKGTLTQDDPKVIVRLQGSPLITGVRYQAECVKCDICSQRYSTAFPAAVLAAPKYDVSCYTALAIGRYSMGLPMHRIEKNQAAYGVPISDATQWDLLKKLYSQAVPIYKLLQEIGANGNLYIYDDTTGRILEDKEKGLSTHCTAFISVYEGHKIHLFFTGPNHAGKNAGAILSQRTSDESVVAMMDASPSNIPQGVNPELFARFILCFCLVHGRRKFVEIFQFFDEQCDFVLDQIGAVYKNEKFCKTNALTPAARLEYHQKHSQPFMEALYLWLNNVVTYETHEANSSIGNATNYMLRHWEPLTTFLRVAGAPLDSSWAERMIKIAIRHRRNSLFYKTTQGANVGDCLMSLIYTAEQNGLNPYDYLNMLQRYPKEVASNPELYLPWNYQQTTAASLAQAA